MTSSRSTRAVSVRVPATSANLGAGYDTFGLALGVFDELAVSVRDEPGISVDVSGVGVGIVPTDESNLVATTIAKVFDYYRQPLPGLRLVCTNVIPHSSGLGSSAAAIVSGILAARGLLSGVVDMSIDDVYRLATDFEGHPDNVAPAIFGGFTVSWMDGLRPMVARPPVATDIRAVVFVPDYESPTSVARTLVPAVYPKADALANVARAALFVHALSNDPSLLLAATEDTLHQPYRAPIMRPSADLVDALRASGYAAVISGAGPTVLALCVDAAAASAAAEMAPTSTATRWRVFDAAIDNNGATVDIR